ncbi:M56 family metallopeptidase [Flagellimonas okinawensis]|uniref:M56 family metallopeptidase n=1 Tax=Flagellimonas okinawensis TaxID=3031324 RepID=A0ABT5XNX4_9FLAO|nr:M56 family metallopeptidase [[Muricauda] okinawensis]MDF0707602.1 M56 family metallopeptidase [[Muricauda] okinawensis]
MLPFILKSTACLAIFLVFYKLVLENESVHHFKRFYLLGAFLAAIIIPNLVFVEYVEATQSATILNSVKDINDSPGAMVEVTHTEWNDILWGIYALGVVVFAIRFFKNLGQIGYRIRKNPKLKQQSTTRVLMGQPIPPHTFFSYIFLNKRHYEDCTIPEEVLLHEETHAKQKHSLDILLIELAQVIFWFNPLIYLLKNSIKLNHEFLADQAVVNKSQDRVHYQNTLLSYLSHDSFETYQSTGIANAINYSSIKKRFTVMKTNTSKKAFILKSFLLLPITALLLFGFSERHQIEMETSVDHIINMELLDNNRVKLNDGIFHFSEIAKTINQHYLPNFDSNAIKVKISARGPVHYNTLTDLSQVIRTTGIDLIEVMAEEVIMEEDQFKNNVSVSPGTTLLNTDKMTLVDNGALPEQQSATREEMKEYNALAKKYNKMDSDHMIIKKSEVMRLKVIYGKMSEKQRADAEPFPNFPPPPPAPGSPEAPKSPMDTKEIIEIEPNNPPLPPAPPSPPKPIEHIKKMVAKGASFTLNGKEISGKKAIEVVQKNQHINIDAREANGTEPIVKLSTEPIVIEN